MSGRSTPLPQATRGTERGCAAIDGSWPCPPLGHESATPASRWSHWGISHRLASAGVNDVEDVLRACHELARPAASGPGSHRLRGGTGDPRGARATLEPPGPRVRRARRRSGRPRHHRTSERHRVLRCVPGDLEARSHAPAHLGAPAGDGAERDRRAGEPPPGRRCRARCLWRAPDRHSGFRAGRVAPRRRASRPATRERPRHDVRRQHRTPQADPRLEPLRSATPRFPRIA